MRRWHMKRQQLLDWPAMIRDPAAIAVWSRNRHGQTRMRGTEIIDRTDQIHAVLQRQRVACERAASAGQRRQTLPKRCVEPFDVRCIDHPGPVRSAPERLDAGGCAIHDTALNVDHPPLGIALHDLRDAEVAPGAQPRAARLPVCTGSRNVSRIARM